jgi:nicotinate-nucleotide adenylyltransferase
MKAAILGGTFNPIHYGHLFIADVARTTLGYDRVIFVPSNVPAHKDVPADPGARRRLRMVRLALAGLPWFVADGCEITRGGVSYMIDTVADIERRYRPRGRVGLILGDDLLAGFPRWKRAQDLAGLVDLLVCHRESAGAPDFSYPHRTLDNSLLPLSSTEIRGRVAAGRTIRFLVPERVRRYIERHGLYSD